MVKSIREVERALGEGSYVLKEKMKKSREFSRSLFLAKDIKIGKNLYRRKYPLNKTRLWLTVRFLYLF